MNKKPIIKNIFDTLDIHSMDTDSKDSKPTDSKSEQPTTSSTASNSAGSKAPWGQVHSELQEALSSWQSVSKQAENKVSPDEEQLEEVRKILLELKEKLKNF